MAKKKLQKLLALVLSTVMLASLATGCGQAEKETEVSKSTESSVVESSVASSATDVEEEALTYPLDTDDKLVFWSNTNLKYSSAYKDASESPFHVGLSERTGVEIEWQFPQDGVGTTEAFNLLLTDEVLPDIIFHQINKTQGKELMDDGVIYDLTEYLPKYAPDYWAALNDTENYPYLMNGVTTADGKVYTISACLESDYNNTYMGPVVRKDWLDECGLKEPVTLEDWEVMLTAFKEKYGVGLGMVSGTLSGANGLQSGTGAYAHTTARYFLNDNNEVDFAVTQPEWKEYIEILHRWYENGLIDKDSVTMDTTALRTKAANGEIGVAFVPSSNLRNFIADAENLENGAEWIGLEHPRVAAGEPTSYIQITSSTMAVGKGCVITTSCPEEKLITALQFLNYGFTEEGFMYWNFGEEGVSYTLDKDGNVQWTDLVLKDELGAEEAKKKYCTAHSAVVSFQAEQYIRLNNVGAAGEAIDKWVANTAAYEHIVPSLTYTDEETLINSDKSTPINTYVKEMALKFIVGDESLDKYDEFVKTLYEMGLQDLLDIRNAAYQRYLANK